MSYGPQETKHKTMGHIESNAFPSERLRQLEILGAKHGTHKLVLNPARPVTFVFNYRLKNKSFTIQNKLVYTTSRPDLQQSCMQI